MNYGNRSRRVASTCLLDGRRASGNLDGNSPSYRKLQGRQRVNEKNAAGERGRHGKGAEAGKMAQHRIIAFRSPDRLLPIQGLRTYFGRERRMLAPAHPQTMLFMNP
jgi:hypothetical protein